MPTPSFKDKLSDWQVLVDNLTPHLTDLPQVTADHAALSDLVTRARGLESTQGVQKAALRATNQQRRDIETQGRDLATRLAASLQGSFGPKSEKLIEFGLKPRPRVVRRVKLSATDKLQKTADEGARAAAEVAAMTALKAAQKELAKAAVN